MLAKTNRADKKTVEEIFKKGVIYNTTILTLRFIKKKEPHPPRVSFIAPKSVAKKAVLRNRLRRCGYSILKNKINNLPKGFVGVLVFRKSDFEKNNLEKDLISLLSKI